jgi:hypothetical protein
LTLAIFYLYIRRIRTPKFSIDLSAQMLPSQTEKGTSVKGKDEILPLPGEGAVRLIAGNLRSTRPEKEGVYDPPKP